MEGDSVVHGTGFVGAVYFPGLVSTILTFLTPRDHCRAARVCKWWHSESGLVNSGYTTAGDGSMTLRCGGCEDCPRLCWPGLYPFGDKQIRLAPRLGSDLVFAVQHLPPSAQSVRIVGPLMEQNVVPALCAQCPGIHTLHLNVSIQFSARVEATALRYGAVFLAVVDISDVVEHLNRHLANLRALSIVHSSTPHRTHLVDTTGALRRLSDSLEFLELGNLVGGNGRADVDINAVLGRLPRLEELRIIRDSLALAWGGAFSPPLDVQNLSRRVKRVTLLNCGEVGWDQHHNELPELEFVWTNSPVLTSDATSGIVYSSSAQVRDIFERTRRALLEDTSGPFA